MVAELVTQKIKTGDIEVIHVSLMSSLCADHLTQTHSTDCLAFQGY